jgi:hypothetical protein
MPLRNTNSVLPQTPRLENPQPTLIAQEFDLKDAVTASHRPGRVRSFLLLGAFVVGILAVAVFSYRAAMGGITLDNAQFYVQVTIFGYLSGCTGLYLFRFDAEPPVRLRVEDTGLGFIWGDGQATSLSWNQIASQTDLFDWRKRNWFPEGARLQLVDDPLYFTLRVATLQPPRAPRIYLTPQAFDSVLLGATRAGLRATQYGDKVVLERPNLMNGF